MGIEKEIRLEVGKEYQVGWLQGINVKTRYLGEGIFTVLGKEKEYVITGGEGLVKESGGVIIPSSLSSFLHDSVKLEELGEPYLSILKKLGEDI